VTTSSSAAPLADLHVVVAGAAIGGATAALLLARAGARVTLLERVSQPRAVGAGIVLQPNGLAVLFGLGLRDALEARATVAREARFATPDRVLFAQRLPDFGEGLDHALVIRRGDLFTILLDAVAAEPRIEASFGAEVTAAGREGSVRVGGRTLAADLVVGADGVRSRVREHGDFGARVVPGKTFLRAIAPVVEAGALGEWWTRLGIFGAAPVPDGTYFFSSAPRRLPASWSGRAGASPAPTSGSRSVAAGEGRGEGDERATLDPVALAAAWTPVLPVAGRLFASIAPGDLLVNRVEQVRCRSFVDGRLVLVGDAAHAMAPNLGQGANSAMVDAAVLVAELARGTGGLAAALARYDARRRPAVARVQRVAWRLGAIADWRGGTARWLRDRVVTLGSRLAGEATARAAQQEDPPMLLRLVREL
jgi:2-polyprenyl-6-methoxyphenol hydroxylase-like FAD-dependent oxidoreductase